MIGPHAFHVLAGFILAALLVVCGFMFGPPAEQGQVEPISSGSLAAYLLGATLIVLNGFHADTAMIVFGLLVAVVMMLIYQWYVRNLREDGPEVERLLAIARNDKLHG